MGIGIALYALAVVAGVLLSGGIIEISENIHTSENSYTSNNNYYQSSEDYYEEQCFKSPYYPCESNITIKVGDDQTFSIYPNTPWFTKWKVDGQNVLAVNNETSGQTYIAYTYAQNYSIVLNTGIHKIEVSNLIDKHTWYVTVT